MMGVAGQGEELSNSRNVVPPSIGCGSRAWWVSTKTEAARYGGRRIAVDASWSRPGFALPPSSASTHRTASEERATTEVTVELSVSLDGYVNGPDVNPEEPMVEAARPCTTVCSKGPTLRHQL